MRLPIQKLSLVAIFLAPVLCLFTLRPQLRASLEDTRPIFTAQPLESIQGARAGQRVKQAPARKDVEYEVRAGDSWWSIAQRFHIRDASELARQNENIALVPGVSIRIPAGLLEPQP